MYGTILIQLLPFMYVELKFNPLEEVISALQNAPILKGKKSSLKVEIREDQQRGVFTNCPIHKGCPIHKCRFIAEYAGEFLTMSRQWEKEYQTNGEGCYILNIGEDKAVDATRCFGRVGQVINHASQNTNCKLHRSRVSDNGGVSPVRERVPDKWRGLLYSQYWRGRSC